MMPLKSIVYTFSVLIVSVQISIGQKISYSGKIFINKKLEQLDFINDSIVKSSFRAFPEKYSFLNDSLELTMLNHFSDMGYRHLYKVTHYSPDSLFFIYGSQLNPGDTMKMVNIQKYIIKLVDFDSLRVDMFGPLMDYRRLIVRKDRTVKVGKNRCETWRSVDEKCLVYKYGRLSEARYTKLLDTLSKCLIFMIPSDRGLGGIDAPNVDFILHTNGRTIISKGTTFSQIHTQLVNYFVKEFFTQE